MTGQIPQTRQYLGAAAAVLTLALAIPALAQSVGEFRLQPASPATLRAQGPVDPDAPVVPAAAPQPSAAPSASASPAPAPTPAPQPTATQQPRRDRPEPAATPAPASPTVVPKPAPSAAAPDQATPLAPVGPLPEATFAPTAAPATPVAPAENLGSGIAWWWLVPAILLAALIGAAAAWYFLRRREPPAPVIERPRLVPVPTPEPVAEPKPQPAPTPRPVAAATADLPLEVALEPVRFSVTLVNATLQYRLRLTNRTAAPLGPIALAADMIAAHASLPEEAQLARDGTGLELRHEVPALAPGETAELKGEMRLPLAQVTPIRHGPASLLVPLVRLRAETGTGSFTWALVVGEEPVQPGGPLRPFRLDHGPRIFGTLAQRELAAA